MIKKIIKFNSLEKLFLIFFMAMCFQNLMAFQINSNFSFKMYHLVSLAFIPILIKQEKIVLPPKLLLGFIIYLFILSAIMFPKYGISNIFFNYIFSLYILIIICTLGRKISKEKFIEIMKTVTWIVLIAIFIKCIIYRNVLISFFLNPYGHPILPTFFGGGVNLEASWMGLLGVLFYNDKKGYIYCVACSILSALYASRVGLLASALTLLFLILKKNNISLKEKMKKYLIIFLFSILGVIIATKLNIFDYLIRRFISIGEDSGSAGRIAMWKYVIETFQHNPFGYGLGNSIEAIELISGKIYADGNIHNLFFQMLLDGGIIGELWYVLLICIFVVNELKNLFKDPFVVFIFGYLLLSLFQFRGGDSIFFFILGIYLVNKFDVNICKNKFYILKEEK